MTNDKYETDCLITWSRNCCYWN